VKISELISYLDEAIPPHYAENYDNTGLIVGNDSLEVNAALLSIDITEEVVEEAISKNCGLIIAHHPILFNGIKRITGQSYVERALINAIKHDISIYAAHTNLDNLSNGVNAKICEKLALSNTSVLKPKMQTLKKLFIFHTREILTLVENELSQLNIYLHGTFGQVKTYPNLQDEKVRTGSRDDQIFKLEYVFPVHLEKNVSKTLRKFSKYLSESDYGISSIDSTSASFGSGMVGEMSSEMDQIAFLHFLKRTMKTKCIRHSPIRDKKVRNIAVCGGAGSFLLPEAIKSRADVFITSDFKYHQFFDAEDQILIADIGHFESEQFTTEIFYNILTKKIPTFALLYSNINTNPINYFFDA